MSPPPPVAVAAATATAASSSRNASGRPSRSKLVETIEQLEARRAKENHYRRRKRDSEKAIVREIVG